MQRNPANHQKQKQDTTKMQFRTPYAERERIQLNTGKGLTEQAHKDETDINHILADYRRTGLIKHARKHEGAYDDVTATDFQQSMIIIAETKSMFEGLPSEVRKDFNNNPADFLNFVQNPKNEQKLSQMGILKGNDGINIHGAASGAPVTKQSTIVDGAGADNPKGASETPTVAPTATPET